MLRIVNLLKEFDKVVLKFRSSRLPLDLQEQIFLFVLVFNMPHEGHSNSVMLWLVVRPIYTLFLTFR